MADDLSPYTGIGGAPPDEKDKGSFNVPEIGGLFGGILEQVLGFFVACFRSVWSGFLDLAPRVFMSWWGLVMDLYNKSEDQIWQATFKILQDQGIVDHATIEQLLTFKGLPFPTNSIFNGYVLMSVLHEYLGVVSHTVGTPTRQELMKKFAPELPNYRDILQAAFVAPEKTGEIRDIIRRDGFSDESIDLMFLSAYRLYDMDMVRTLWLRGVLNDDEMFMRMRELGFTDTRTKEIVESWNLIPGPNDILHMVAKEAFEPDAIKLMGLGDEFPEEQVGWLEKQGLSREWALKYWYAHWEQPSIQMGFEMLHRGIITRQELDMLFRTIEIPPYWREKLIAITYTPFTRVDVRRMHDMQVLTDAELIQAYKDIGYDEAKALKMAEFTKRYNAQSKKDLTMSQIITGYKERIVSREDTITLLGDLEYTKEDAEYLLDLEDYKEYKELEDAVIDNIRVRYEGNLMDVQTARARLNELNLPAVRTEALIEKWTVNLFEDMKLPSKTDLDKFLKGKIITRDEYIDQMFLLGYNEKYINWYLTSLGK